VYYSGVNLFGCCCVADDLYFRYPTLTFGNALAGAPLNVLGIGAGGGCGIGLGLGWGFGAAYGTKYLDSKLKFEGIDFYK